MSEPRWLAIARGHLGVKEIPGIETSPIIYRWLVKLKSAWTDDATPWCGTFVATCFSESGIPIAKHWYRARDWLNWGVKLDSPTLGCVVVYARDGGGHVGFVVGRDQNGNIMTLGGNQGDRVSIAPFGPHRVLGYRWPAHEVVRLAPLPLLGSDGKLSINEA